MRHTVFVALLAALFIPPSAHAGQSFDNCSGFIDSVPATITTQGIWCLRADLSTAISSGNAITVAANNVSINCNRFKLGGLAAGPDSVAVGIRSTRLNTSVRHCNVRGFLLGIHVSSTGGNLVESNRLDGNIRYGIALSGDGSMVRDNQVFDTGSIDTGLDRAVGIYVEFGVDVINNLVSGVRTFGDGDISAGIQAYSNNRGTIRDNRIKEAQAFGTGSVAYGVFADPTGRVVIRGNDIQSNSGGISIGISCSSSQGSAYENIVVGYAIGVENCVQYGNLFNPN